MDQNAKYSTRIAYSVEDKGYIATVPELPGCSAFGETAAEALNEIGSAIEAWISAAQEAGNPIPPPAALDASLPSGKFLVRVAKTVHAQLSVAAQREGISLNQYVGTILATATLADVYSHAATITSNVAGTSYAVSMATQAAAVEAARGLIVTAPHQQTTAIYSTEMPSIRMLSGGSNFRVYGPVTSQRSQIKRVKAVGYRIESNG